MRLPAQLAYPIAVPAGPNVRAILLLCSLLLLPAAEGRTQASAPAAPPDTAAFPLPDRPVSRIVAPRWIAEDRRDAFGEADRVMELLGIGAGTRVADIGAGDGYYVARLSARVGTEGLVFAEDIEPRYLSLLRARAEEAGWPNVRVIEGTPDDPAIPTASIDVALMIHMYHEITSPFALLHRLAPAFRPGGRLAVLDVDAPTDRHGTPPRLLQCELAALGYARVRREAMPDGAYLMVFRAPTATERTTSATDVRTRVARARCRA